MLRLKGLHGGYGAVRVLRGVSLSVESGEVVGLLGRNGAGKTTTLKTVIGLLPPAAGSVEVDGRDIASLPAHEVPKLGVGYVPQGRGLFRELSVMDNLRMGLLARESGADVLGRVLDLFPVLRERLQQAAGTLSGGQQQMLAMGRALCLQPKVLLLDEPSEGLQPSMVARVLETVRRLRGEGVAVLLVEQRVEVLLEVADRVVFIENGRTVHEATPAALREDSTALYRYVGVA